MIDPATRAGSPVEAGESDGHGPLLSVVVTYNDGDRIADCLAAVRFACRDVESFEVVVVDSNSTDATVRVATEFDARLLWITDDGLTTPGAAHYVGTRAARGDYLSYVDGDVELAAGGWIRKGIDRLEADPALAGVDGYLNERRGDEPTAATSLHGVARYDAAASPTSAASTYLDAWGDVDCWFELRVAGFELCHMPAVTGTHPDESSPFE